MSDLNNSADAATGSGIERTITFANGSFVYTLTTPVRLTFSAPGKPEREDIIASVSMRTEVLGSDMLVTDDHSGDLAKSFALIAKLCGIPFAAVAKMNARDIQVLMSVAEGNAPAGQTIGATS